MSEESKSSSENSSHLTASTSVSPGEEPKTIATPVDKPQGADTNKISSPRRKSKRDKHAPAPDTTNDSVEVDELSSASSKKDSYLISEYFDLEYLRKNKDIPPPDGPWPEFKQDRFKKRLQKNTKRFSQYRDYMTLLEQRLAYIERQFNLNKITDGADAGGSQQTKTSTSVTSRIRRVAWKEFKALAPSRRKRDTEIFAIDVLAGEPVINLEWRNIQKIEKKQEATVEQEQEAGEKNSDGILKMLSVTGAPEQSAYTISPVPERIRINSKPLALILSKIQGSNIEPSTILFRPYRTLLYHRTEIRDWLKTLENKWNHAENGSNSEDNFIIGPQPPEKEFPKNTDTYEALQDLGCLVEFIDKELMPRLTYLENNSYPKILFSDVWHLFKPGDEVLGSLIPGTHQVYRVMQLTGVKHQTTYVNMSFFGDRHPIVLHCKYLDFNGKILGPVVKQIEIPFFEGEREIRSLPVYPLRFAQGHDQIQNDLVKRGERFMEYTSVKHLQFVGTTLDAQEEVDSQVVVDFEQTLQHHTNWEPKIEALRSGGSQKEPIEEKTPLCPIAGCCNDETTHTDQYVDKKLATDFIRQPGSDLFSRPIEKIGKKGLDDSELLLLNHRVFAFILRSRKWASIHIDDVTEVKRLTDSDGFDQLVLPPGHKQMVRSLVHQHFIEKQSAGREEEQIDLVRGKGKGLIILLHGAPGVGKTSTAECVAESFNRPLFPITCGDLGITASDVENRLETNFTLAHRWGCVLLLDEADIFLSERTKDDFLRNSLVSVFLRVLEYYAGILFLTTNRVGSFDEAFKSRIHISLYYPPLDKESTIKVWKMNIERTRSRKEGIKIKEEQLIKFAEKHCKGDKNKRWNGRQIRNAFQTAIALAEYEALEPEKRDQAGDNSATMIAVDPSKITLRREHFETVSEASQHFDQYLKELHGLSSSTRAHQQSLRYDEFQSQTEDYPHHPTQHQGYGQHNFLPMPSAAQAWQYPPNRQYSSQQPRTSSRRDHGRNHGRDRDRHEEGSGGESFESGTERSDGTQASSISVSDHEDRKRSRRRPSVSRGKEKESSSRRTGDRRRR